MGRHLSFVAYIERDLGRQKNYKWVLLVDHMVAPVPRLTSVRDIPALVTLGWDPGLSAVRPRGGPMLPWPSCVPS